MLFDIFDDIEEKDIQKYYREIAYEELLLVLRNNFSSLDGLNVLQIGAANGELTQKLVKVFNHVTAIDPKLTIEKNYPNLTKVQGYFTRDTDCKEFNVIVICFASGGDEICPCELGEDIVYVCKRYNIPFFIILCNCTLGFKTKRLRYNYLISQAPEGTQLYKDQYGISYMTNLNAKEEIKYNHNTDYIDSEW